MCERNILLCLISYVENITAIEQYIIDAVRQRRIALGISQEKLSIEMNVSKGFIANVENTKYRAKYNIKHLNELAKILKCSPKDFMPSDAL